MKVIRGFKPGAQSEVGDTITFKLSDSLKEAFSAHCAQYSNTVTSTLSRYMSTAVSAGHLLGIDLPLPPGESVSFNMRVSPDLKKDFSAVCKSHHVTVSHALRKYMAHSLDAAAKSQGRPWR